MRSIALLPLAILAVTACSQAVQFEGDLALLGVKRADPDKLHMGISASPGVAPPAPKPGALGTGPINSKSVKTSGTGLRYRVVVHGGSAEVNIRFWYDSDGDGNVDPGEPVGALPGPVKGEDKGMCSGNSVEIPKVTLTGGP